MYLLKPIVTQQISPSLYLHSTMYLLKLFPQRFEILGINVFTFHYVSIKTLTDMQREMRKVLFTFHYVSIKTSLHTSSAITFPLFTFHYVSIKTVSPEYTALPIVYLHSTMYLLKLTSLNTSRNNSKAFTFHYVSIKTQP